MNNGRKTETNKLLEIAAVTDISILITRIIISRQARKTQHTLSHYHIFVHVFRKREEETGGEK